MTNHDDVSARLAAEEVIQELHTRGDAELDHKYGSVAHPLDGLDSESLASFNLRRIRKELGFSQQQIADHLKEKMPEGVRLSQTQIAKIERGERPWRVNEMMAIADALAIRWDEFFRVVPGEDYRQLELEAARLRRERARTLEQDARELWRRAARDEYEADEYFLRVAAKYGIEDPYVMVALENRYYHQDYVKDSLEGPDLDFPALEERRKEALEYAQREWAKMVAEAEAAKGDD
ncbi:helix-turn-helix domain-containing protein [Streptomyces anulatus]|uniref:helix-turn-helix domain-containing protein n=1 Tax=Streptomyces TaxID=1883 RepID=UPI00093D2D28|nr:helix-turn-helix transcriptional regulator [Streptomyces sp. TSRI0395]OKI83795.1 hypothetical protein AMK12_11785 [Streptomyces sp. TSRI0395]